MRVSHPLRLVLALAGLALAAPLGAVEREIVYPAKVTTTHGEIYHLQDLQHELERGSFVFYDGETEGRVPWRDIDEITFVGNIGHGPGAIRAERDGTRRVLIRYADGHERYVDLVVGRLRGFDGKGHRNVSERRVAQVDFDTARIAPALYKVCSRGHVWEQRDYLYCPYDGLELEAYRVDQQLDLD